MGGRTMQHAAGGWRRDPAGIVPFLLTLRAMRESLSLVLLSLALVLLLRRVEVVALLLMLILGCSKRRIVRTRVVEGGLR